MEHFIVSTFGALLLPLVLVVVIASIMGIKPEVILMPLFNLIGAVCRLFLELAILLTRILGGFVSVAVAGLLNGRQ